MSEHNLFSRKKIIKLLIPLIFEQFMIVLVTLVDSVLLALVNEEALSALSLVDTLNLLIMQLFMAIGAGGSIIAAQYIGKRDREGAESTANQTALMVVSISLVLTILTILTNKTVLAFVYPSISNTTRNFAESYFFWSALSYPLYALYNGGIGLLYAQSKSRLSMLTSIVMNLVKIVLNWLFISLLHLDVLGAGLATLLSRMIGAGMVTYYLINPQLPIHYKLPFQLKLNFKTAGQIIRIALPAGIENIIFLLGKLLINTFIASYSGAMIAANAACNTLSSFINIPSNAINLASITIISQCMGAKRIKEAVKEAKNLLKLNFIAQTALSIVMFFIADYAVQSLHLSAEASEISVRILKLYSLFAIVFWSPAFGLPNSLRAGGDNRQVMIIAVFSMVVIRVTASYFLGTSFNMQVDGIWIAMYLDWIARCVFYIQRFKSGKWYQHQLI